MEIARLAIEVTQISYATFTSSATSRCTHCAKLSPTSTKPASKVYIPLSRALVMSKQQMWAIINVPNNRIYRTGLNAWVLMITTSGQFMAYSLAVLTCVLLPQRLQNWCSSRQRNTCIPLDSWLACSRLIAAMIWRYGTSAIVSNNRFALSPLCSKSLRLMTYNCLPKALASLTLHALAIHQLRDKSPAPHQRNFYLGHKLTERKFGSWFW